MKVTAIARRAGDWWAVEVPEVPGVFTQVKHLSKVEGMAADAVRTMLEDPTLEVEVSVDSTVDSGLDELRAAALAAVGVQREAASWSRVAMARAVRALRDADLPTRDVAVLLGISHQRVSQIEQESSA